MNYGEISEAIPWVPFHLASDSIGLSHGSSSYCIFESLGKLSKMSMARNISRYSISVEYDGEPGLRSRGHGLNRLSYLSRRPHYIWKVVVLSTLPIAVFPFFLLSELPFSAMDGVKNSQQDDICNCLENSGITPTVLSWWQTHSEPSANICWWWAKKVFPMVSWFFHEYFISNWIFHRVCMRLLKCWFNEWAHFINHPSEWVTLGAAVLIFPSSEYMVLFI